jgi:hypothetical protein
MVAVYLKTMDSDCDGEADFVDWVNFQTRLAVDPTVHDEIAWVQITGCVTRTLTKDEFVTYVESTFEDADMSSDDEKYNLTASLMTFYDADEIYGNADESID